LAGESRGSVTPEYAVLVLKQAKPSRVFAARGRNARGRIESGTA
jgi:hypothetical protein